jgi:hypothetical protein
MQAGSVKHDLPQVAETDTPQAQDASRKYLLYDEYMTRVFIADAKPEERSALRLLLLDLKMDVVGEATDWTATLADAPTAQLDTRQQAALLSGADVFISKTEGPDRVEERLRSVASGTRT